MREDKTENKFFTVVNKILELIMLNSLWLVFSIPLFTIGSSTCGFCYGVRIHLIQDRDHVWNCFWRSFKSNFKQGSIITIILLLISAFFYADIQAVKLLAELGKISSGFTGVFFALLVVLVLYAQWVFVYLSKFENTVKATLKNSLLIMFINLPTTILMAIIDVFAVLVCYLFWPAILVMPGVAMWIISVRVEKMLNKYIPEETEDNKEEISD